MSDVESILTGTRSFLVVDWPTPEVPESLARAGYEVVVHGGPGADDYTAYELVNGEVARRHVGRRPERADVVYTFRPLEELPEIVETAQALGARAVWVQSGRDEDGKEDPEGCSLAAADVARARSIVEAAGLAYLDRPYIAGAVRRR